MNEFEYSPPPPGHLQRGPGHEDPCRDADDCPAALHRDRRPVRGGPGRVRHQEMELEGAQQRGAHGGISAARVPKGERHDLPAFFKI